LLSATNQKAICQNETVSVKSNEQSAKQSRLQMVFKNVHHQRSYTLVVEYW